MSTPLTHFEKWNYQIQYQIFSRLDKNTEQTQKLRFPAFLAFGASNLAHLTTGTASVAELTIHGLGLVLTSYPSSERSLCGRTLLKQIPLQFAELVIALPIVSIMNAVIIAREPKFYILSNNEYMKVNRRHLEASVQDIFFKPLLKHTYNVFFFLVRASGTLKALLIYLKAEISISLVFQSLL